MTANEMEININNTHETETLRSVSTFSCTPILSSLTHPRYIKEGFLDPLCVYLNSALTQKKEPTAGPLLVRQHSMHISDSLSCHMIKDY